MRFTHRLNNWTPLPPPSRRGPLLGCRKKIGSQQLRPKCTADVILLNRRLMNVHPTLARWIALLFLAAVSFHHLQDQANRPARRQ